MRVPRIKAKVFQKLRVVDPEFGFGSSFDFSHLVPIGMVDLTRMSAGEETGPNRAEDRLRCFAVVSIGIGNNPLLGSPRGPLISMNGAHHVRAIGIRKTH